MAEFTVDSISNNTVNPQAAGSTLSVAPIRPSGLVVHALRLHPGQEIYRSLLEYVRDRNLSAAFIMTCCGSVTRARLRLAAHSAANANNTIREYQGPFEIVSLVGTLSGDEGHLHISLSDLVGHVIGGHVMGDLDIFTTAEVVLGECQDLEFSRQFDRATGFPELVINNRYTTTAVAS